MSGAAFSMFYILSKVVFFVIAPSHLCLIAVGLGLALQIWTAWQSFGRKLAVIGFVGIVVLGFSPVGNLMLYPLEERFAAPKDLEARSYDGIIFLGGFEDGSVSRGRQTLALIDAGERLSESVRLARKLPQVKVIFSGGAGSIFLEATDAGGAVGKYLRDVGIAAERIVVENKSRNTWENAVFTRDLIKPAKGSRYLLVTSAWHMPRSMGIFRQVGFNVDAYPVDYRIAGPGDLQRPFSMMANGLKRVDRAAKEWIGLFAYWISGRSNALFPK
ncbi:MAG: YdcF family protein [Pseudomonadota bacterium]